MKEIEIRDLVNCIKGKTDETCLQMDSHKGCKIFDDFVKKCGNVQKSTVEI